MTSLKFFTNSKRFLPKVCPYMYQVSSLSGLKIAKLRRSHSPPSPPPPSFLIGKNPSPNRVNKTIESKLRWKDKCSKKKFKQRLTQINCKVITNLGCCETSGQLMTPPGAADGLDGILFFLSYSATKCETLSPFSHLVVKCEKRSDQVSGMLLDIFIQCQTYPFLYRS